MTNNKTVLGNWSSLSLLLSPVLISVAQQICEKPSLLKYYATWPKYQHTDGQCSKLVVISRQFSRFSLTQIHTVRIVEYVRTTINGMLQNIQGAVIYPKEYFNPYDDPTGRLQITQNTYSIHWYLKSPHSKAVILRSNLMRPLHRMFGVNCFSWLKGKKWKKFLFLHMLWRSVGQNVRY